MKNQLKTCFGITSKTEDDKHIVMIDADIPEHNYTNFKNMLLHIQDDYELSDFYILKTKNGFNAFTLDKLELDFLFSLLSEYDLIDPEFTIFGHNRGYYVLRMNKDKLFLGSVDSCYSQYEKSLAHYNFFIDIMQYPLPFFTDFDKHKCVSLCAYRSYKHGDKKIKL